MDLGFFDPYISIYKIQDRGWPTEDILRDYILYTSEYDNLPGIIYNTNYYTSKTNCYMTFTDEQYLPCVIRQAQRIKYLNSKYEYIVMVDENDLVSQKVLKENNIHYISIKQKLFSSTIPSLVNDKNGKMSKSSGDFLTVSLLKEKGYNPLSYRLMCLQSHYRKQLVFTIFII